MIDRLLDHPLLCAALVIVVGYAVAAVALWPFRGQR